MKLDIPDEYLPLIVTALENYAAYTRAVQREDAAAGSSRLVQAETLTYLRGTRAHGQTKARLEHPFAIEKEKPLKVWALQSISLGASVFVGCQFSDRRPLSLHPRAAEGSKAMPRRWANRRSLMTVNGSMPASLAVRFT